MIVQLRLIHILIMHTRIKVADIYSVLGGALFSLGKFDESIEMFDYALKLNPRDYESYVNKGFRFIYFQDFHYTLKVNLINQLNVMIVQFK